MTNEFEEEVFEVMDDLRGDNRVAVPDAGTIRRRAGKQQNRLRAAAGVACVAVVAAIGFGVWASNDDSPATTETAGVDEGAVDDGFDAVANDSAPFEKGGPNVIDSQESFGEWMIANRLRDDRTPSVILTARDDDPTTHGVRLNVSAFPLDGSFEYFAVFSANCGPRLEYGMIRFTDDGAELFEGLTPESTDIGFGDVGYDCTPPRAERLGRVLLRDFEIIPIADGLRLANDTEHVDFFLIEANPVVDKATPEIATTAPPTIPVEFVDILTGEPEGSRGFDALSSFTLQYDPELDCLYHDEPDNNGEPGTGGRIVIVWPADYSAVKDADGVAVLEMSGIEVARTGETFQIAGGAVGGGSGHCGSIGEWIANGGPISEPSPKTPELARRPFAVRPGDCIIGDPADPSPNNVPCEDPHDFELYRQALVDSSITEFDDVAIGDYAEEVCSTSLEAYVSGAQASGIDYVSFHPTEESWNNLEDPDRVVHCWLFDVDGQMIGRAG